MPSREPDPNNPLAPFYPADVPPVPGNARTWVAILLALVMTLGTVWWIVGLFL